MSLLRRAHRLWLSSRLGRHLFVALVVGLMLLTSFSNAAALTSRQHSVAATNVPSSVQILPAQPADSPALVVEVGLHVRNIYNLSLVDQSFLAEGWYWYLWSQDLQEKFQQYHINPDELLEFSNEIELGQYSVRDISASSPILGKPGEFGRIIRFSGKFFLEDVPQRFAPFDPQQLRIELEVKPEVFSLKPNRIVLRPSSSPATIVGEDLSISGYELDSVSWRRSLVSYPDEFLPGMRFSRATAVFVYGKNEWSMFMKWIFPILIVLAIVILSPSIEGVLGELRIAIPPSALLTLVVMQDSYKNSFPPAPYLTYLDELYIYSYIVCLAVFVLFLVGTNLVSRASESDRERVVRQVNRTDIVVQLGLLSGVLLVGVVGWFT